MTKSNAHLFKPFVDALVEGKDVTYRGAVKKYFSFGGSPEDYTIKEPPVPVPLTYEDMEPGCHIRNTNSATVYSVEYYTPSGVSFASKFYGYDKLMHQEIYRPSTGTWSPAHK